RRSRQIQSLQKQWVYLSQDSVRDLRKRISGIESRKKRNNCGWGRILGDTRYIQIGFKRLLHKPRWLRLRLGSLTLSSTQHRKSCCRLELESACTTRNAFVQTMDQSTCLE